MERAKQLIAPVLAAVLIAGAAGVSRWMAERRGSSYVGGDANRSHSRVAVWEEPITYHFLYPHEPGAVPGRLTFARVVEGRIRKGDAWSFEQIRPRPGWRETWPDVPGDSAEQAWWNYRGRV
jgi:hypothetical protein